jgi:hypothetical protein
VVEPINVYILTALSIDAKGNVASKNVGVTFDVFEAESHNAKGIENEFDTFTVPSNWREDAGQSSLIGAMRDFRDMVAKMQEAALR